MDLDDYEIPENPEELLYRAIQLDDLVCFQHLESTIDPEVMTSLEIPPNTKIYEYLGLHKCKDCDTNNDHTFDCCYYATDCSNDASDEEYETPGTNRLNKSKRYVGEVKQARRERRLSESKSAIQIYKDSIDETPNRQRELYIEAVKELKSINRKRIANGLPPLDRSIIDDTATFKKRV